MFSYFNQFLYNFSNLLFCFVGKFFIEFNALKVYHKPSQKVDLLV